MTSVGIRELKNRLSEFLRRVQDGETIAVTDRGRVVAELRSPVPPVHGRRDRYAELVASGVIQPARKPGPLPPGWPGLDFQLPPGTAQALIDEDRGD